MLQRQDYILRLIEQLARVVARLLDDILGRTPDELGDVEADLNAVAHRIGLDLELARRLEPESLHLMISSGGTIDPGRCWVLAELLFLYGLQAERRLRAEAARQSYARSLYLYRCVEPGWSSEIELPDAERRRLELEQRIQTLDRPVQGS